MIEDISGANSEVRGETPPPNPIDTAIATLLKLKSENTRCRGVVMFTFTATGAHHTIFRDGVTDVEIAGLFEWSKATNLFKDAPEVVEAKNEPPG